MDLVLAGMQWSRCLVYMDDIIVVDCSFDEHLHNPQAVFERLRQAGPCLKPSKCSLMQKQVNYLGYVSEEGVATDPVKADKVASWPEPTFVGEAQQFLGLASYYRRFVQDFHSTSSPRTHRSFNGRASVLMPLGS